MKYIMFYIISLPEKVAKKNDSVILSFLQLNKITWNKNPWYNMMEYIIQNLSTCSNIMAPHFGLQDPFQLFNVSKVMGTRDCTWRNVWKAHLPVKIAIWGGKKKCFQTPRNKKWPRQFQESDVWVFLWQKHSADRCAHLQINLIVQLYL